MKAKSLLRWPKIISNMVKLYVESRGDDVLYLATPEDAIVMEIKVLPDVGDNWSSKALRFD